METGLHLNVTFDEYDSWPFEHNSGLAWMARSPKHYVTNGHVPTAAQQMGIEAHALLLDPIEFLRRFTVMPDYAAALADQYQKPKASKAYKEMVAAFVHANPDRTPVPADQFEVMVAMRDGIATNPIAQEWLYGPGPVEVSVVWDDDGTSLRCKGRLDKLRDDCGLILDYKTTRSLFDFDRAIWQYHYHRQAALYIDGYEAVSGKRCRMALVAQEKTPPYCCLAAVLDDDAVQAGRAEYKRLLGRVAECRAANSWPGPSNPDLWRLPAWATMEADAAVDFGGIETVEETDGTGKDVGPGSYWTQ